MNPERPEVPPEIEEFLVGLAMRAGQMGGSMGGGAAGARGGARGGARAAARMHTKVEERIGDASGTREQVAARLIAAFPRATRLPANHVRLAVPIGVSGLQQIVIDLESSEDAADSARVKVRLRGFGKEGLISRKPTRTVTDQAWSAVLSDGT